MEHYVPRVGAVFTPSPPFTLQTRRDILLKEGSSLIWVLTVLRMRHWDYIWISPSLLSSVSEKITPTKRNWVTLSWSLSAEFRSAINTSRNNKMEFCVSWPTVPDIYFAVFCFQHKPKMLQRRERQEMPDKTLLLVQISIFDLCRQIRRALLGEEYCFGFDCDIRQDKMALSLKIWHWDTAGRGPTVKIFG